MKQNFVRLGIWIACFLCASVWGGFFVLWQSLAHKFGELSVATLSALDPLLQKILFFPSWGKVLIFLVLALLHAILGKHPSLKPSEQGLGLLFSLLLALMCLVLGYRFFVLPFLHFQDTLPLG